MHEFLLGEENILRDLPPYGKSNEYEKATSILSIIIIIIIIIINLEFYEKIE